MCLMKASATKKNQVAEPWLIHFLLFQETPHFFRCFFFFAEPPLEEAHQKKNLIHLHVPLHLQGNLSAFNASYSLAAKAASMIADTGMPDVKQENPQWAELKKAIKELKGVKNQLLSKVEDGRDCLEEIELPGPPPHCDKLLLLE